MFPTKMLPIKIFSGKAFTRIVPLMLLPCAGFLSGTGHADEKDDARRVYDVEVIVFENTTERYLKAESWPQKVLPLQTQSPVPETDVVVPVDRQGESPDEDPESPVVDDRPEGVFEREPTMLLEAFQRLRRSRYYRPLFFASWQQSGLDNTQAFDIPLSALTNHAVVDADDNTVIGSVRLVLGRYLHFYADMEYIRRNEPPVIETISLDRLSAPDEAALPLADDPAEGTIDAQIMKVNYYPLSFHRRMRSKETHYIDHPLAGVLVRIEPAAEIIESAPSTEPPADSGDGPIQDDASPATP